VPNGASHFLKMAKVVAPLGFGMIKFRWNFTNPDIVHHVILWTNCQEDLAAAYTSPTLQVESTPCLENVAAGGGHWVENEVCMPEGFALPIEAVNGSILMVLEIHFENDANLSVIDTTSIEVSFAPLTNMTLEQVHVSTPYAMVGQNFFDVSTPSEAIPPQTPYFRLTMNQAFSYTGDDIEIIAIHHHMHTLGWQQWATIVDEETGEAVELGCETNFQQNRQEAFHFLDEPIRFGAGKSIVVDCVYSSRGKAEPTTYGFDDENEMCQLYLLYRWAQDAQVKEKMPLPSIKPRQNWLTSSTVPVRKVCGYGIPEPVGDSEYMTSGAWCPTNMSLPFYQHLR